MAGNQPARCSGQYYPELAITAMVFVALGVLTVTVLRQLDSPYTTPCAYRTEESPLLSGSNTLLGAARLLSVQGIMNGGTLHIETRDVEELVKLVGITQAQINKFKAKVPGGLDNLSADVSSTPSSFSVNLNLTKTRVVSLEKVLPGSGLFLNINSCRFDIPRCQLREGCVKVRNVRGITICGAKGEKARVRSASLVSNIGGEPVLEVTLDAPLPTLALDGTPLTKQIPLGEVVEPEHIREFKTRLAELP